MAKCEVCFRHCDIPEGERGACGARINRGGVIEAGNYGRITGLALDPIEKKPLAEFYPGSMILSAGSYGCNLRCPFCQNHEISWSEYAIKQGRRAEFLSPQSLTDLAVRYRKRGNIGVAFTYNEPLIGYEFVRDTARLVHEAGMKNVMVTNGTASLEVLAELTPYIDAMNIDIKCFSADKYAEVLGGDLEMTMAFIREAAGHCHVELTSLIVPGLNDSEEEMRKLTEWIAGIDEGMPLHVSRLFPRFRMNEGKPTDTVLIYRLVEVASERLKSVYPGNC
ncbi:MAG: AmmeMemoRadiSam system radical SAM enzyme [Bacillota bacterium]|nr:AmmeMemoRadiSam system radical SAM enzyme [Bacillota bacterium]